MLPVVWSAAALEAADAIADYISLDNPDAADRISARLFEATAALATHGTAYRPGRITGTREMVVTPSYIVVYRIDPDAVRILNVLHTARRYP